jgi:hypothetical protein
VLERPLYLFEPSPAVQAAKAPDFFPNAPGYMSAGDAMFAGQNRPRGALLTYWVREGDDTAKSRLEVVSGGQVVRTMAVPGKRGLNRTTWDLRRDSFRLREAGFFTPRSGPRVPPARYSIRLIAGSDTATSALDVFPDPRMQIADHGAKFRALVRLGEQAEVVTEALNRVSRAKQAVTTVLDAVADRKDVEAVALRDSSRALGAKLDSLTWLFVQPPSRQGFLSPEAAVLSQLLNGYFMMESSLEPPTAAQRLRVERAEAALTTALDRFNRVFSERVATYRRQVERSGFLLFADQEPLTVEPPR